MKIYILGVLILLGGFIGSLTPHAAYALSCLPTDVYLKDVVGKEDVFIFEGTSIDRVDESTYTREVLMVKTALQGYVENEVVVYHENHPDWGYLCNAGPKAEGSTGVYVTTRDTYGKYHVSQRLESDDMLAATLKANLADEEVEGGISELTPTDRMNQIMTTISDLFKEMGVLLKEYVFWKGKA